MPGRYSEEQLLKAFKSIDLDGSGTIDKKEMSALLKHLGMKGQEFEDTLKVGATDGLLAGVFPHIGTLALN